MNAQLLGLTLSFLVPAQTTLAGGGAGPAPSPAEVEVIRPVSREVRDYEDCTGRTEASVSVSIRARVSGTLERVLFRDGAEVKKGDLLLEIDPRPYRIELDRADAALTLAEARLRAAESDLRRARQLSERKLLGADELEKRTARCDEARAELRLARAHREGASLTLSFTRVTAPISGRVGRRQLDPGNVVRADETTLAVLTSRQPMYVTFDLDERAVLRLRRTLIRERRLPVSVGLADEKGHPHRAEVDFIDTELNRKTGTLRARATLPNADGLLVPGLTVRVRLTTSDPYRALLVPERAVERNLNRIGRISAPGAAFVLIVNPKNEVEVREIELGQRHENLVVVRTGLEAADAVVLAGPGKLPVGRTVRPKTVEWSGALPRREGPRTK